MAKYLREVIYEKRISFGSTLGDSVHRVWGGMVWEGGMEEDMIQGRKQVWRKGMVRGGGMVLGTGLSAQDVNSTTEKTQSSSWAQVRL